VLVGVQDQQMDRERRSRHDTAKPPHVRSYTANRFLAILRASPVVPRGDIEQSRALPCQRPNECCDTEWEQYSDNHQQ
jgi:hypothetical protein